MTSIPVSSRNAPSTADGTADTAPAILRIDPHTLCTHLERYSSMDKAKDAMVLSIFQHLRAEAEEHREVLDAIERRKHA